MAEPDLSLHEWAVLGLLVEHPRHGFAVSKELAAGGLLGEVWRVPRPQVYRSLDRLIAAGMARAARDEPSEAGPARTVIEPTRAGRAALRRWLARPVEHLRDLRTAFLVKAVLAERLGRDVGALADAQHEHLRPVLDGLARADADAEGTGDLVALWRYEISRAADRFLTRAAADRTR